MRRPEPSIGFLRKGTFYPSWVIVTLQSCLAEQVDAWLADRAKVLATDTVSMLLSILRRTIRRAQARDMVRRNVAMLSEAPHGQEGRRSKSLTLVEAKSLLRAAEGTPMAAYVVVSLLTGARTEELRALTWSHLDLDGDPPSMQVWRSVRRGGETKTAGSRRTFELPTRCVSTLREHRLVQDSVRAASGGPVAGLGPGVHNASRDGSGCCQRPTFLSSSRRGSRPGPRTVGAT